jgi:hypothetical protein
MLKNTLSKHAYAMVTRFAEFPENELPCLLEEKRGLKHKKA